MATSPPNNSQSPNAPTDGIIQALGNAFKSQTGGDSERNDTQENPKMPSKLAATLILYAVRGANSLNNWPIRWPIATNVATIR